MAEENTFLNSSIKAKHPDALLLAEVYNPSLYRDYIRMGKMDYLYDKVEFYDSLKKVMQNQGPAGPLEDIQLSMNDIEAHMLHFLENHDEQRIASPGFAGKAEIGKPALAVSALISRSPTMLYFGQEVGEDGSEETGFGDPTRTTIFDYAGVPAHQRWMNMGKFDGGQSTAEEISLRRFYENVMQIASNNKAIGGDFVSLHQANLTQAVREGDSYEKLQRARPRGYTEQQFAFIRHAENNAILVIANFSKEATGEFTLTIPSGDMTEINALGRRFNSTKPIIVKALLPHDDATMTATDNGLEITISLAGLESKVFDLVPD